MTWSEIYPSARSSASLTPVMLSSVLDKKGGNPRARLVFRPWMMDKPPAWLVADGTVRVLLGSDGDTGSVRLLSTGPYRLRMYPGGRGKTGARRAFMLTLRSVPIENLPRPIKVAAMWSDRGGGWIDIDLRGPAVEVSSVVPLSVPAAAMATSARPPPARNPPFTGIAGVLSREELSRRSSGPIR